MNRQPGMDALAAAKKRQYARRKKRLRVLITLLLVLTILAVWTVVILISARLMGSNAPSDPVDTTPAFVSDPPSTSASSETVPPIQVQTEIVRLSKADLEKGDLILVSTLLQRAYTFPETEDDLTALYGNKSASYRISGTALRLKKTVVSALNEMFDAYFAETGNRDYQITQGYRTYDEQKSIYDSYQEIYGPEQGALLAALPGYSEHHTGYAFDMNVYTADGVSYSLASAGEANPIYAWIYDNAAKYGFVLRYPEEKTSVTGITNEPWHFRYVGRGHAAYMHENDLTLEEYIALLYKYPADGKHLTFSYDGTQYEVFYAEATGEETEIEVPSGASYTVSGNNWDGFIITITR